jgi:precorrin-2 dehydrogenase/sirohydrochlorin ferrochelatase
VVIAGSGEPAEAKLRLLESSPAELVRVEGPQALLPGAYTGAVLVFIADPDEAFCRGAHAAAKAARALVNVADRPELCDFTTPAVVDRGEVVAAIGTGGASPMLATMLRNDIEQRVPEGTGRIAALFRRFQDDVRSRFPELHARRAFLRDALSSAAAEAARTGDMDKAQQLFREALARGPKAIGKIQLVSGLGPADLVTLRASRALAAADLLVIDPGCDPDILAMARRDAERADPEEASAEHMVELARDGRRVVRILARAPRPGEAEALAASGVTVEVLPVASA